MTNFSGGKNIALWVLQILTAVVFLMAGFTKLSGKQMMIDLFAEIGLGQWFRFFTGGIEFAAAVMLFVPRLIPFGALLLVGTMIGAVVAHLFIIGGSTVVPFVLLFFSMAIFLGRSEDSTATMAHEI
jgi:putative oxidoreductase